MIPIGEVIRATCPVCGPSNFILASISPDYSGKKWWMCETWRTTPEYELPRCTMCIFEEDMTPDGATVRDFQTVIVGIFAARDADQASFISNRWTVAEEQASWDAGKAYGKVDYWREGPKDCAF